MNTKPCKIEGCPNLAGVPGSARGLCKAHYLKWWKRGDTTAMKASPGDGTIDAYGYRKIHVSGKQVREHRHVVEQVLGRPLEPHEHIHHIDGDKLNNHPDNLQVVNQVEHSKIHATFRNETHKECAQCHTIKPRWQFTPQKVKKGCNPDTFDPHHSHCRDCVCVNERATSKERWQKEKAKKGPPQPRQCIVCENEFIPTTGPQKLCNNEECHRKRKRQHEKKHRDTNPEYVQRRNQMTNNWRKAHPERVAEYRQREKNL